MRHISVVLLVSLNISTSPPLLAQDDGQRLLGLGISIDPTRIGQANYLFYSQDGLQAIPLTNASPIMFYVPINVADRIRLEPSFGFYSTSSSRTTSSTQQGSGYPRTTSDGISVTTIGVRGTYVSLLSKPLALYVGPRLDLSFLSATYEYSYMSGFPIANTKRGYKTTTKETDITVGAVVGAEYFPISQFSVGGELSVNYLSFGNPEINNEQFPPPSPPLPTETTERKQHTFRTDALFFLRWYFFQSEASPTAP